MTQSSNHNKHIGSSLDEFLKEEGILEEVRILARKEALPELCAMEDFDRITHTPGVMQGKACVRGMRVTVGMIERQIAAGRTVDELLFDYPYLEREDVLQALQYQEELLI